MYLRLGTFAATLWISWQGAHQHIMAYFVEQRGIHYNITSRSKSYVSIYISIVLAMHT